MKRIIATVLATMTLLCLISCGKSETSGTNTTSTSSGISSEETASEYTPSNTSSEDKKAEQNAVVRYFKYAPGGKLQTTYDVDYSVEGSITVNAFDKHNYKTGSTIYDYDENGLVVYSPKGIRTETSFTIRHTNLTIWGKLTPNIITRRTQFAKRQSTNMTTTATL